MLTGGARDVPERQRTLRATIAWSYDLLEDTERRLFARLGVYSSGCRLESAEEVCGAQLDTLGSLVDKSLLREDDGPDGEPRYVMLETVREFALERLDERPEADDVRRRHAMHFLDFAELAEVELRGRDQSRWLDWVEADHDNIRSALAWSLDRESDTAVRFTAAMWRFWYVRARVSEGRRWIADALERAQPSATEARARTLDGAGYLAGEQGDGAARGLLEASLSCAREVRLPAAIAIAASHLSGILPLAEASRALALGEEAVSLAGQVGDRWTLSVALNNLGEVARELGDHDRATSLYEESLSIARELGDAARTALCLVNLGEMELIAGRTERARSWLSDAENIARQIGDKWRLASVLGDSGWVALADERFEESSRLFRESLSLSRDLGIRQLSVETLPGLAGAAAATGDSLRAARLAGATLTLEALVGRPPTPVGKGIQDVPLEAARAVSDEATWETAWKEGVAMSLDDAIEYALSEERASEAPSIEPSISRKV